MIPEDHCTFVFQRRPMGGKPYKLGEAIFYPTSGWRFVPEVRFLLNGRRISRKFWPTMESCIPRWVGYPDGCESYIKGGRKPWGER